MYAVIPQASTANIEPLQESHLEQSTWLNTILTTALVALGAIALGFAAMLLAGMYTFSTPWVFTTAVSSSLLTGAAALFYAYSMIAGSSTPSTTYPTTEDSAPSEASLTFADSNSYSPRTSATETTTISNPIASNHSEVLVGDETVTSTESMQIGPIIKTPTSSYTPPTPSWSILGLWKGRDLFSTHPRSLVAIYEHQGMHFGRMLLTYDDKGEVKDTIFQQKDRSIVVRGNPPYCGMDIVYSLNKLGSATNPTYSGEIIDPDGGTVYSVDVWRSDDNLIVRPKLWFFGINITWDRAYPYDLPKVFSEQGFSIEGIKDFVPSIPKLI